ncbi:(d)CMP kinase [Desulfovibrio ferrophilus]|uniref:Cytidylate kinase n=1 Tax=Desulfovibrio ferrophilus TaxID=241368 RepID=A0A2Z6B2L1_9BACT|nr:(d)CMP kinase [Desulfovibrio ferrophilus]BBD09721.1 cytidylate kinase [Desulfovibrio ferrophilus]
MSNPTIITLDGPAGVGKTTLAKRVADALGVAYLDTGAMFRATALILGHGADELSEAELETRLADIHFSLSGSGSTSTLSVNGHVIGDEIRTEEVGMMASTVGTLPRVRAFLKEQQQTVGAETPLVAEGRDMGTVVFPGASAKIFLDAAPEIRAQRRVDQLLEMDKPADLTQITEQIKARDHQDRNRAVAPLKPAEDAHIIDTGSLNIEGVFNAIMNAIT